jgi:hypothetical protein
MNKLYRNDLEILSIYLFLITITAYTFRACFSKSQWAMLIITLSCSLILIPLDTALVLFWMIMTCSGIIVEKMPIDFSSNDKMINKDKSYIQLPVHFFDRQLVSFKSGMLDTIEKLAKYQDKCGICWEPISNFSTVLVFQKCNHSFHFGCLLSKDQCLPTQCYMCRKILSSDTYFKNNAPEEHRPICTDIYIPVFAS